MRGRLHTFGDHVNLHCPRHVGDALGDRESPRFMQLLGDRPVQLEDLGRQRADQVQGRVTGSEIVDGDGHSEFG